MAKKATAKAGSGEKKSSRKSAGSGRQLQRASSSSGGSGRSSSSSSSSGTDPVDALIKLLQSPLVIDLLAVGATAALAAITESRSSRTQNVVGNSKKTLKAAGKAAASAVGRRLQNEFEEITAASKGGTSERATADAAA